MFDEYSQYYGIIISKQVVVVGQQVSVSQSWSKGGEEEGGQFNQILEGNHGS